MNLKQRYISLRRRLDKLYQDTTAHVAASLLPSNIMKMKQYFELWEKKGYHVTPVHFYETIPDTREINSKIWSEEPEIHGVDFRGEAQLELAKTMLATYQDEFSKFPHTPTNIASEYYRNNFYFHIVDAALLHSIIRHFKPQRIIEIGSGFSTFVSANAMQLNNQPNSTLTAIEPYPNDVIKRGFIGLDNLIVEKVQDVDLSIFRELGEDDILFIDSSHVSKIGSDVNHYFQRILPQLNQGVIIHFHDIFLPYEYPQKWIERKMFWNEQYLLQAFLAFNTHFEIMVSAQYLLNKYKEELDMLMGETISQYIDSDDPVSFFPSTSIYLRKVK